MTIELVSYIHDLPDKIRLTKDMINQTKSDILLFCGHTLGFVNEVDDLKSAIENKHIVCFLQ